MLAALKPPCDGGIVHCGEAAAICRGRSAQWVLAATVLGSSMAFIDGSVVNLALPNVQASLGASPGAAQWMVEIYTLSLSALVLVGGALGDHFGRRRIFALGIVVFALASVACGLARNATELVAGRGVQGLGAAMLVPGSLALISASFEGSARERAFGRWSAATAITSAAGPVVGGWLIALASWRAVFFVNVPLALATLWIVRRHVPESRADDSKLPLDGWGALLATSSLLAGTYGLIDAQAHGLGSTRSLIALGCAAGLLGAFLLVESRTRAPMVPLQLFRSRIFGGANLLTLLLYAALSGALFLLPFNLIQVQGYPPSRAGWALLPFILLMFALSRSSERLVKRFGARRLLTAGPLLAAVGFALLAVPAVGGSYWSTFLPGTVVLGLGMGITVAPLTTTVMGAVPPGRAGVASGINNAVARAAGLLAIAAFGIVLTGSFERALDRRVERLQLPGAAQVELGHERRKLAEAQAPRDLPPAQRAATQRAIAESYVAGFRNVMLLAAALAAAGALTAGALVKDVRAVEPAKAAAAA